MSQLGDWLSFVAVSVVAVQAGGGALGLAVVFAAHALPAAALAPFAGAVIDRVDRRRVLVGATVIAAGLTAAMAAAAAAGWTLALQLLLVARSAISVVVPTAETAALRRVVPADGLVAANAILAATWSVAYVAGMALGGAAALLGPALALVLDAASFVVAAALYRSLPALPPAANATRSSVRAILAATPRDTRAALVVAARDRPLLAAVIGKAPLAAAGGAGWIALAGVGAAAQPFGAAALSIGVLQAARGAGTGVGPAVAARLAGHGVAEAALQRAAWALALAAIAALAWVREPVALALVAGAWGIGTGTNWVLTHAALQRHAPDAVIGRLAALDELLVTVAMVGSAFAGAAVVDALDVAPGAAALVGAALGAVALAACPRR